MLQMSTDLLRVNRLEKAADAWILASGVTGSWVNFTAAGVGQPAIGDLAVPIFTESNRDGTAGFTSDVGVTGGVTVLFGKMQAKTDQFTGTPAIGDKLYVDTDGTVAAEADLSTPIATDAARVAANVVAVCTAAPHNVDYMGRLAVSVIEYVTV